MAICSIVGFLDLFLTFTCNPYWPEVQWFVSALKLIAQDRPDIAGGMFFLYGYGGTGKTFMWKTLASALRSKGDIVLTVASSGIASLLLPNDRTAHSKFSIHVPTLENSTCNIHQALDKTLNDIMRMYNSDNAPFGGKVVVFGGNLRKILPIIPRGSRSDIMHATKNASYLWDYCTVLKLTKKIKSFSQWLIDVGDGKQGKGHDGCYGIELPYDFLITNFTDSIKAIVSHTYPDIQKKYKDEKFLKSKAILAATNEFIDHINDYILNIIPGEEKEYFNCDSIDITDVAATECYEAVTPEFLHSLKISRIPNHIIRLKTNTHIMLIQNLDQAEGLCNETRLIISRMTNHVIEMTRRQFLFIVSYAMIINKSQGQSLQFVGLYLPQPVFSHGQLYVAFLRVQSKSGLKILIHDKEGKPLNITTNVVLKEVLQNL
ncbi:hypothetical protein JHK82_015931 [Glycine max]|nr:hypothetical protein JHK85_016329 [Glycine max]KAG5046550.1 hypothetical protein JHK86_015956 [Glycine max]KAG5149050.1 hypothetical protein JHK82_015931 [Glycine max]